MRQPVHSLGSIKDSMSARACSGRSGKCGHPDEHETEKGPHGDARQEAPVLEVPHAGPQQENLPSTGGPAATTEGVPPPWGLQPSDRRSALREPAWN